MIVQMIGHVLADTTVNIGRLCSCVCVHMGAFEVLLTFIYVLTHVGVEFVYDTAGVITTHLVVYGFVCLKFNVHMLYT